MKSPLLSAPHTGSRKPRARTVGFGFSLSLLLLAVAGCSVFSSKPLMTGNNYTTRDAEGLAYFLPKSSVRITAERTGSASTKTKTDEIREAQLTTVTNIDIVNLVTLKKDKAGATSEVIKPVATNLFTDQNYTFKNRKPLPGENSTRPAKTNMTTVVHVNRSAATQAGSHYVTNTTRTEHTVTWLEGLTEPTQNYDYTIVMSQSIGPDPDQMYLLKHHRLPTATDQLQVTVGTNGLLNGINSTNNDRSGAILEKLAELAIETFKLAAGVPAPPLNALRTDSKPAYPKKFEVEFDPANDSERTAAIAGLKAATGLDLLVTPPSRSTVSKPGSLQSKNGFFYRPLLPWKFVVSNTKQTVTKTLLLPNEAPAIRFDIRRTAFGTSTSNIGLTNGLLTGYHLDKPSEIEGFVDVPINIVKSVAGIPTNLLQLKINLSNQRNTYNQSLSNEVTSAQALLEAQRRLIEAQEKDDADDKPSDDDSDKKGGSQ